MGFSVTFWGVRGTVPCPMRSHMGYGGNTACVEVRAGGQCIILDAGTGIRPLGQKLLRDGVTRATLLLSHTHLDHISGFPFFTPAYIRDFNLRVMSCHFDGQPTVETVLTRQMDRPFFPVPLCDMGAGMGFIEMPTGGSFSLEDGIRVRTAPLNHPDGSTGYRIEHAGQSLAYVTDTEHVPGQPDRNVLDLIDGADLVIYDSTYTEEEWAGRVGWGHSTWEEGARLCRAAGAKRLGLFHHEPDHDDTVMEGIERAAQAAWPDAFACREGTTITLA
ncbi:MBL fold metallo-hydrolase [Azospirillum sp. SYSU D00513]|uniref:MBL fold metallo-hydrolase n=1 Tax=Azospirillum sp. SYSU D00513 TaxID=2812561 RepID=UPI001A95807C|nr:MBL fold metallo-hydrolase [Azospirillum sp. SYSU D00513]